MLLQTHDASTTPTPRNARLRALERMRSNPNYSLHLSAHAYSIKRNSCHTSHGHVKPRTNPPLHQLTMTAPSFIPFPHSLRCCLFLINRITLPAPQSTFLSHIPRTPINPPLQQQLTTLLRCSHLPPSQLPSLAFPRRMSSICSPNQV